MYCTACGAKVKDGAKFCIVCGARLARREPSEASPHPGDRQVKGANGEGWRPLAVGGGGPWGADAPSETRPAADAEPAGPTAGAERSECSGDSGSGEALEPGGDFGPEGVSEPGGDFGLEGVSEFSGDPGLEGDSGPVEAPGIGEVPEAGGASETPEVGEAPEPRRQTKRSLATSLLDFRRTALRAVPTFVLVMLAMLASAVAAYALYRVATEVVLPAITQQAEEPAADETAGEKPKKKTESKENKAAHAAYQEVLDQYRELIEKDDYDQYGGYPKGGPIYEHEISPYWSDNVYNTKYPLVESTFMNFWDVDPADMVYLYRDLDGDGVDELIVAGNGGKLVLAIYVYVDGVAKGALDTQNGHEVWLCENGVICMSLQYSLTDYDFFTFKQVMTRINGGEYADLEVIDCVPDDSYQNLTITHSVSGEVVEEVTEPLEVYTDDEGLEHWTSTSLDAMVDEVVAKYPPLTDLDWQQL